MESQAFKLFLGFIVVMLVGFGIVAVTRESPQEKLQGAFLQTSSLLSKLALEKCTEAVRKEAGTLPYSPTESSGDHTTNATLIWKNVGAVARAECRYVMDQGITLLKIDDRIVIEKQPPQIGGAAPKPEHH